MRRPRQKAGAFFVGKCPVTQPQCRIATRFVDENCRPPLSRVNCIRPKRTSLLPYSLGPRLQPGTAVTRGSRLVPCCPCPTPAFYALLAAAGKEHGWTLIAEHEMKVNGKTIRPDGTFKDQMNLVRGYWEATPQSSPARPLAGQRHERRIWRVNLNRRTTLPAILPSEGPRWATLTWTASTSPLSTRPARLAVGPTSSTF